MSRISFVGRGLVIAAIFVSLISGLTANAIANQIRSADILFPRMGIRRVEISPTGTWVVAVAVKGRLNGILVQRIGADGGAVPVPVVTTNDQFHELHWVGPNTLLVSFWTMNGRRMMLIRFSMLGEQISTHKELIDVPGGLVDPLEMNRDELLWEFDHDGKNTIHRVTLEHLIHYGDRHDMRGRAVRPGQEIVKIYGTSHKWLVDREGEPRVAWRRDDKGYSLLVRGKGENGFQNIYSFDDEDKERWLQPVALSPDEKKVIVVAYNRRNTLGLHEFDPETGEFGETLFHRFDVDVSGIRIDNFTHELISAVYEADGQERFHYFEAYRDRYARVLDDRFPVDSIDIVGATADRLFFVFFVSSATNPGEFYFRDVTRKRTHALAVAGAEIDRTLLSEVGNFVVDSADGTEIEAFLTLPKSAQGPAPLVVMPHGGPHGIRDRRSYDPFVQYLASWGFAVLQPNYRGSSGYGLEYLDAGKKEWAKGIEDDIDAAVEYAMALPSVDGERVCIVGGSYGGFSALASVIRHRERYQCAISINGVADIPLLYDSSDMADSKNAMEFYEQYVGDLETERDQLEKISPVYNASEIEVPVFFIYGTEDRRVDPDHSHRMMLMLDLFGKRYDSLEIKGMAHSPRRLEWLIIVRAVRRNLTRYLMPSVEFVRDPVSASNEGAEILPRIRFDR